MNCWVILRRLRVVIVLCTKSSMALHLLLMAVSLKGILYISGVDTLISYNSSGSVERKFCEVCGSSLQYSGNKEFPDLCSIATATFDTEFKLSKMTDIYQESKAC